VKKGQARSRSGAVVSDQQEGLGVLPGAGAELPAGGNLVGDQRKERGDPEETAGNPNPGLAEWPDDWASYSLAWLGLTNRPRQDQDDHRGAHKEK